MKKITYSGLEQTEEARMYVTNHSDIVFDTAFLDYTQFLVGNDSVEIGIGDNLLSIPWVRQFVRINKCFIVRRGLPQGEMIKAFVQREGRAKDSDDRTQESILKMFALGGDGTFIENLKALNICPVCISYEYD